MFSFEKLDVYQLSLDFAKQVANYKKPTSRSLGLIDQIKRASTSISLNIAEGSGRYGKGEKNNFTRLQRFCLRMCTVNFTFA
ncbi:MAG: four helix bundle protein [Deltaproteobacteria bacterium]|nr:four helix bundle protein [Deltaproteobacteria bacterium]